MKKISPSKTFTLDAAGKVPGRLASQIAHILIGKHRADYTPHIDAADRVVVAHADGLKFSGKKLEKGFYYRHSGYQGGLKKTMKSEVFKLDPADVIRRAVSRMLPKNRLRTARLHRLTFK